MEMTSLKNSFLINEQNGSGICRTKKRKKKKSITYSSLRKKKECRDKKKSEEIMDETFPNEAKYINLLV